MEKILLDTSFLLLPFTDHIDILSYFSLSQLYITSRCFNELQALSNGYSKKAQAAKAALALIKQKNLKIVSSNQFNERNNKNNNITTDQDLINIALTGNYNIATIDKELIKIAKSKGIGVYTIRNRQVIKI